MDPRERIKLAISHKDPDKLPVDFGSSPTTGIHVSVVYRLRQHYGLDKPGTPVKVVELYQMLGEVADDLKDVMGVNIAYRQVALGIVFIMAIILNRLIKREKIFV